MLLLPMRPEGLHFDDFERLQARALERFHGPKANPITTHHVYQRTICSQLSEPQYPKICDDNCREVVMDPANELWVCTISRHCFDRLLSPEEMESDVVSGHLLCLAICRHYTTICH
ncbi:unnamed protein product [Malus baccata var. baccata]